MLGRSENRIVSVIKADRRLAEIQHQTTPNSQTNNVASHQPENLPTAEMRTLANGIWYNFVARILKQVSEPTVFSAEKLAATLKEAFMDIGSKIQRVLQKTNIDKLNGNKHFAQSRFDHLAKLQSLITQDT